MKIDWFWMLVSYVKLTDSFLYLILKTKVHEIY